LLNKNFREKMKIPESKPKRPGRSGNAPTLSPEPDHRKTITIEGKDDTCSGIRGNIVLTTTDRQDRPAEQLNRKIELPDRQLAMLEDSTIRDGSTGRAG